MERDDAGVLLDRDNKGRRKSLGGTSTALAARVETSVDPIRNDRPPLAQVVIGQCASEGFGVTPDRASAGSARERSSRKPAARSGSGSDRSRWRRSEEHTSELQSLMRISYAVFCLKKKN